MLEPFRTEVLEAGLVSDVTDAASARYVLPWNDAMRWVCQRLFTLAVLTQPAGQVGRCFKTTQELLHHDRKQGDWEGASFKEASHPVLSSARQPCSCHVRGLLHSHVVSDYFRQSRIFAALRMCLHCAHYMHPDTHNGARSFIFPSMSRITLD